MTPVAGTSINRTARLAGGLYLSLVPLGIVSFVYVPAVVLVPGDATATARNILASEWLFRVGTATHLVSQIVVVFLVLLLNRLLRPVNVDRAVLMSVLALVCVPVSCLAEVNALGALSLLEGPSDALIPTQLPAQAMHLLDMRRSAILIAQVFWGLWMLPLASLVFRSRFLPGWLGVPVLITAAGYLYDSGAHLFSPGRAMIAQFSAVAELVLPLWLLIRGVDVARWHEVAAAVATGEPHTGDSHRQEV